jgi:hypothetical protein
MGMSYKKSMKRLKGRQKDYEKMCSKDPNGGKSFTKPGSMKK